MILQRNYSKTTLQHFGHQLGIFDVFAKNQNLYENSPIYARVPLGSHFSPNVVIFALVPPPLRPTSVKIGSHLGPTLPFMLESQLCST